MNENGRVLPPSVYPAVLRKRKAEPMTKMKKILTWIVTIYLIAALPLYASAAESENNESLAPVSEAGAYEESEQAAEIAEPEATENPEENRMETEWIPGAGEDTELRDEGSQIAPMSALAPTITWNNTYSQVETGTTVRVSARATTPCYRMSAKYVYGGTTKWLGDVFGNSYSKTFTPTATGTYTVTVLARNYPESHPQSYVSSRTFSFTVFKKVVPTISLNSIADVNPYTSVSVRATSSTPCYRMVAKYTYNGVDNWLGEVSSSSYNKSFTPTKEGYYTVTVESRSYAPSDVRTATSSRITSFYVRSKVTPTVSLSSISNTTTGQTVTVSGSSSTPCYRMAASYTHNGKTIWLGEVSGSSYRKTFTPTSPGTYTVTLESRSYAASDIRSAKGSASRTFTVTAESKTLSVPLYKQEESNTCGSASGRMILASYGISVKEEDFRDLALKKSGTDYNFTIVYAVKDAINDYLSSNGKSTSFQYINTGSYSTQQYSDLIFKNIKNGHPVQAQLKINDTAYFPYEADHYVVIKGMQHVSGAYQAVVNDPHMDYCQTLNVPIDKMLVYNKAHSGFVICVNGL